MSATSINSPPTSKAKGGFSPCLRFRPHLFGSFDTFKCPLQLRKAMGPKTSTNNNNNNNPTATMSSLTTGRGIDFERHVITMLKQEEEEKDGSSDQIVVIDCAVMAKEPPNVGDDGNINAVLFKCITRCSETGKKMFLDQLELHPPATLGTTVSDFGVVINDELIAKPSSCSVDFAMMKPDVVILEKLVDGTVAITVVDIKSSAHVKRSHRLQIAFYAIVIERVLAENKTTPLPRTRLATMGQVWLPVTLLEKEGALTRKDMRCETFDCEEAKSQVRDFFCHVMPLVRIVTPVTTTSNNEQEEEVPWDFNPTQKGCRMCDHRIACSKRAVDIEDAAMCLGMPAKEVADMGGPRLSILEGVVRTTPNDRLKLKEAQTLASEQNLHYIARTIECRIQARKTGRPVAYAYGPDTCGGGPPPILPGALSSIWNAAGYRSGAAACILCCQPGSKGNSFIKGMVGDGEDGVTQDVENFLDRLANPDVTSLIMWNSAQLQLLHQVLIQHACCDKEPRARTPERRMQRSAKIALLKYFDGVDSRMIGGWEVSSSDASISINNRIHSPQDATVNLQLLITDTIAVPGVAGCEPTFFEVYNALLAQGTTGMDLSSVNPTSQIQDYILNTTTQSYVSSAMMNILLAAITLSPPNREVPRAVKGAPSPVPKIHMDPLPIRIAAFHTAVALAECHDSQRYRNGSAHAYQAQQQLFRLQFQPDVTTPSFCRFKVLPFIHPNQQWDTLDTAATNGKHHMDFLKKTLATFSGDARLTVPQMRELVQNKDYDFEYCDEAKAASQYFKSGKDSNYGNVNGRWYAKEKAVAGSKKEKTWKSMDSYKPFEEAMEFPSGPYVMVYGTKDVKMSGLDKVDDLIGYAAHSFIYTPDVRAIFNKTVNIAATDFDEDKGELMVYMRLLQEFLSGAKPGGIFYMGPRAANVNFPKVIDALTHLEDNDRKDALFVHYGSGNYSGKAISPLNLDPKTLLVESQAKSLTKEQNSFLSSVQNNPLSVLWGPPGTGKTFTLACMLRMFLQHVGDGEPVTALVVAFQHKALEELRTRLETLCQDFTINIKDVGNEQKCFIFTHGKNTIAFTTVWGATKNFFKKGGINTPEGRLALFNVLVVDEASQLPASDGLVASRCVDDSARIILAGDILQLTPIIPSPAATSRVAQLDADRVLFIGSTLEAVMFHNEDRSKRLGRLELVTTITGNANSASSSTNCGILPSYVTQLATSYRSCVSDIVKFVGRLYPRYVPYAPNSTKPICGLNPLQLHLLQSSGNLERNELACADPIIEAVLKAGYSLGVVTPHRRQRANFKKLVGIIQKRILNQTASTLASSSPVNDPNDNSFGVESGFAPNALDETTGGGSEEALDDEGADEPNAKIHIDTVERMQGQQFDVVIIALADVKIGFTYNINRLNVALSRAIHSVVVISTTEVMKPSEEVIDRMVMQGMRDKASLEESKAAIGAAAGHLAAFYDTATRVT